MALCLMRREGEAVSIAKGMITVKVARIKGGRVELLFDAPSDIDIMRMELIHAEETLKIATQFGAGALDLAGVAVALRAIPLMHKDTIARAFHQITGLQLSNDQTASQMSRGDVTGPGGQVQPA